MSNERYSRQQDIVPRNRILETKATIIGVGAIGRQVAIQLTAIGVHIFNSSILIRSRSVIWPVRGIFRRIWNDLRLMRRRTSVSKSIISCMLRSKRSDLSGQ